MTLQALKEMEATKLEKIRQAYIAVLPQSLFSRLKIEKFDVENAGTSDVYTFYSEEYNDACSCHPEYRRECFSIPVHVVDNNEITEYLNEGDI